MKRKCRIYESIVWPLTFPRSNSDCLQMTYLRGKITLRWLLALRRIQKKNCRHVQCLSFWWKTFHDNKGQEFGTIPLCCKAVLEKLDREKVSFHVSRFHVVVVVQWVSALRAPFSEIRSINWSPFASTELSELNEFLMMPAWFSKFETETLVTFQNGM